MENQFITLNEVKIFGEHKDSSPLTVNKNHVIKFARDGKTHTRIQLSKGSGTILVSDDYKTIYQQMTGKVFIG